MGTDVSQRKLQDSVQIAFEDGTRRRRQEGRSALNGSPGMGMVRSAPALAPLGPPVVPASIQVKAAWSERAGWKGVWEGAREGRRKERTLFPEHNSAPVFSSQTLTSPLLRCSLI